MVDRSSLTDEVEEAKEAVEFYAARPGTMVPIKHAAALLTALQAKEEENDQLRLAICGGEDAPGYASSLPLEVVLNVAAETHRNTSEWGELAWDAETGGSWKARAEKAEASLVELVEVTKPFAEAFRTLSSRWEDHEADWQDALHYPITVGDLRRASDVHSRLLEEQLAENAKCSGLSRSQPGVSAVQLPASPSAQHSDGGRG